MLTNDINNKWRANVTSDMSEKQADEREAIGEKVLVASRAPNLQ